MVCIITHTRTGGLPQEAQLLALERQEGERRELARPGMVGNVLRVGGASMHCTEGAWRRGNLKIDTHQMVHAVSIYSALRCQL